MSANENPSHLAGKPRGMGGGPSARDLSPSVNDANSGVSDAKPLGRYVFTSSNPMHWIALGEDLQASTLLCSPDYGAHFLEQNVETIVNHKGVVAVFFDEQIEGFLDRVGVPICFPHASIRGAIEDKCEAVRLAQAAGVGLAPTLLAPIHGYDHLCQLAEAAGLGPNLVVQLPKGNSGRGTFVIRSLADYQRVAGLLESASECRIMQELPHPQSVCIETVVTDAGAIIGIPALDLVGLPELTPNPEGWCGNVIGSGIIAPEIVRQIREHSLQIQEALKRRHPKFFGYSGDDYLLSPANDQIVYQEKNARCTGIMPLSNVAALELGIPPLIVQHLLQYQGNGSTIDVGSLNRRWSALEEVGVTSCLVVKQLDQRPSSFRSWPQPGLYSLDGHGLRYRQASTSVADLLNQPGQAIWIPETMGYSIQPQDVLGRLLVRDRVTEGYALNAKGKAWVQAIRDAFLPAD